MSKTRPPEGADAGSAVRARDYIPRDRMFLFWLRDPAAPVLVGALYDLGLVEHATMTLARLAGLDPAQTRPIDLGGGRGHAIAIRRFDRQWTGADGPARRDHAMSPRSAMRATGSDFSYPNFALR
jgi:hypothetical protein